MERRDISKNMNGKAPWCTEKYSPTDIIKFLWIFYGSWIQFLNNTTVQQLSAPSFKFLCCTSYGFLFPYRTGTLSLLQQNFYECQCLSTAIILVYLNYFTVHILHKKDIITWIKFLCIMCLLLKIWIKLCSDQLEVIPVLLYLQANFIFNIFHTLLQCFWKYLYSVSIVLFIILPVRRICSSVI